MQWDINGSLAWLTITFISIINLEKSNVEADALSRIDWEKGAETIQADSIQAIVTAAITGQGNDHIETIPCSHQTIESLLPSVPDNAQIVCKAITQSSKQSHLRHLEADSFTSEKTSKAGDFSHPDHSLNPQCMTKMDWMRAQAEDKTIGEIIERYKIRDETNPLTEK